MAGLQVSNIIIPSDKLRNLYNITLENNFATGINSFATIALEAAYNEGDEWLQQLMQYLEENLNFLMKHFEARIPKIKVIKPQGTYLVWIDCSALSMSSQELEDFFVKNVKVGFNDGIQFGVDGARFQRINIACARSVLMEALGRIERAVNKIG